MFVHDVHDHTAFIDTYRLKMWIKCELEKINMFNFFNDMYKNGLINFNYIKMLKYFSN